MFNDSCLLQTRFLPSIKLQIGHEFVVEHSCYFYDFSECIITDNIERY